MSIYGKGRDNPLIGSFEHDYSKEAKPSQLPPALLRLRDEAGLAFVERNMTETQRLVNRALGDKLHESDPAACGAANGFVAGFTFAATHMMEEVERLMQSNDKVGGWLSAALEDENVCKEMKADINAWFDSHVRHAKWKESL